MMILKDRLAILYIGDGKTAYKGVDLCDYLIKVGFAVEVVLPAASAQFVTPSAFQVLTHRPVFSDLPSFAIRATTDPSDATKRADVLIIAPATINTIADLAAGLANDLLSATGMSGDLPVFVVPNADRESRADPLYQARMALLRQRHNMIVVEPATGHLETKVDQKEMATPEVILDAVCWMLGQSGPLASRRVVVTAGGTREPLDPIRFIGNRSSGRMGYALAHAARDRGARVTLINTTSYPTPFGTESVLVETAEEMRNAVLEEIAEADVLLMAAAVLDFRPAVAADQKIKKSDDSIRLSLVLTADILADVANLRRANQVIVGFAAETENLVDNAREKLKRKRLDLIVANNARTAMGSTTNQVTLIGSDGSMGEYGPLPKEEVANLILDKVSSLLTQRTICEG